MMRRKILRRITAFTVCFTVLWFTLQILMGNNDFIGNSLEEADPDSRMFSDNQNNFVDFVHRKTTLLDVCKLNESMYTGNNKEGTLRSHFVVDRKHKFVYCAMEKIGSTFWRRLFQIISGASKAKSPFDIPAGAALGGHVETFRELTFDDIHDILENYRKFIIVRDPYARLYSGYMDKIYSANIGFWNGIGKFTVKTVRENPTEKSLNCGHDVTFPEFVKFFIHSETNNIRRDGHFIPMYDHCRPCQVKYDLIAKMESMSEDTLKVLTILNMTTLHDTLSKQFQEDTRDDSFIDQTKILFGSFERTKECLGIYDNQRRMWTKFQTRGLISRYAKFPFSEKESLTLTRETYINALKNAVKETSDKSASEKYRYYYLMEAYSEVPSKDRRKLHEILRKDCNVFRYDCDKHPWVISAFS